MNLLSTPRRISLALGFTRFLKMILGLVVLYLSVKYFGTTFQRDSWVLSIAFWGIVIFSLYSPINETFRTKFIFLRNQEGEESAMKSVNSLMNYFNLSYLVVAIIVFFCIGPITSLLAKGFDDGMRNYLSIMIFSLIPYFMLQQHSSVLIALLNTYESYFYPEIIALLASLINILSIIFLSDLLGIYSLIVATTLNGLILVSVLSCMLRRKVSYFHLFSLEKVKGAKPFVMFSLPMYLSTICAQVYIFVEKSLCTYFGEGAVSVFDYARQITNLPHIVFSSIVPIVMTPLLSMAFINGKEDEFSDELRRFLRLLLCLTGIIVIIMKVNAEQVSCILFSHTHEQFINVLGYLSLAILCLIFTLICGQALIARNKVLNYVVGVIVGNLVSIFLSLFLLDTSYHLETLALYYFIGQFTSGLIVLYSLDVKRKILVFKDLIIIVGSLLITYYGSNAFHYLVKDTILASGDKICMILDIVLCAIIVFLILLCSLLIFSGEERKTAYDLFGRFNHKWFKHR